MLEGDDRETRLEKARRVADELLDDLEGGDSQVAAVLMKAKRLARILRDEDAQLWLDLELRGYPQSFDVGRLGTCRKYAEAGGRVHGTTYYTQSLPSFEAQALAAKTALGPFTVGDQHLAVENYVAAGATQQVLNNLAQQSANLRTAYSTASTQLTAILSGIHSYTADASLALEFGDAAETIFEQARHEVDHFVRAKCPSAVQQLLAINERMASVDGESLSAALTAARRLMVAVADSVFPASDEDYVDGSGVKRKVGVDEYKNRILAYLEQRTSSGSTRAILASDLEHMAARLDAVNDKACKGVHSDVDLAEARLAVIGVYLLIAEVARLDASG